MSGDIRYENDPEDTQIDFENDSITLRAGGANNMVISTTSIAASVLLSSSMPISASSFWVDGVQVSGGGTPGGSSTQVQYNNGGSFAGSANLTFNGTTLTAAGISSTGNTTLGDAGADSVTINAATVNIPNVAAGTDNTVVVYNGTTLVTDEIDSRVWGSTLVDATGTPVANQIATWSDANTAQGLATLTYDGTTLAITGSISGSGNISGSAFYGSGANLTGLPSAAITTYNNSTDNRVITSVNSTTVQGEANLTFDGTTLAVVGDMSGSGVLSADQIKCSGSVAAVSFAGDGSALTGLPSAAISTYNTSGDNRIITSVDATTVQGEADLVFDGTKLTVKGANSIINVTGSLQIGTNLDTPHKLHVSGTESQVLCLIGSDLYETIFAVTGSGKVTVGGVHLDAKFNITGSDADVLMSAKSNTKSPAFVISGSGNVVVGNQLSASSGITGSALYTEHTVIDAIHVSSSLPVSASSFWVDGVQITGGGGGGTPGGADGQVQYNNGGSFGGEAELVYDDSNNRLGVGTAIPTHTLSVTGSAAISGDLTVSGSLRSAKRLEVTSHYYTHGATNAAYLPMGAGNTDKTTTAQEKNQFVAPFSGRLKRAIVRSTAATTTVTASIWVGSDGTEDFNVGGSIIQHVTQSSPAAATAYSVNFSGSSNHFAANQIVGVTIQCQASPGNTNVTCIWEYDDREVF
tara:strand:- start:2114 stop:4192 length:2079 start_codon:yes stop_codon:yes gene_type:complete